MDSLFSEHWHMAAQACPRLREDIIVSTRQARGSTWILLCDPLTQRFHRLQYAAWQVVKCFDGKRNLQEIWSEICEQGEYAISQTELINLLASLHRADLLQTTLAADAKEATERYQRIQSGRLRQYWANPLSIKMPLFYPDAWFNLHAEFCRKVFSGYVGVLFLLIILPATFLLCRNWQALSANLSDQILSASNLMLLWLIYPIVKAVHEWAHGAAAKAFGGVVREVGIIWIVFTPMPYVDASSSWAFTSKWQRALVASAGIMAEWLLGAVAMFVWLSVEPGLIKAIAYNVIFITGVSTLLINGNPLMRYDGYFVLCDVAELPNLGQRATQYWIYLLDKYFLGAKEAKPPQLANGEARWLWCYGLLAPIYRILVMIGLIWFIASHYWWIGVILACVAAWSTFLRPIWRAWRHLQTAPVLQNNRSKAMRRSIFTIAGMLFILAGIPLPFSVIHHGLIWLPEQTIVRAPEDGFITATYTAPGMTVTSGQTLIQQSNAKLQLAQQTAQANFIQSEIKLRQAFSLAPAQLAHFKSEVEADAARVQDLTERIDRLDIQARNNGRWQQANSGELKGRYFKRGEMIGFVLNGPTRTVRVAMRQDDLSLMQEGLTGIEIRLDRSVKHTISGKLIRQVPGGEFDLISAALGLQGGGEIPVHPDEKGTRALERVFDLELELSRPVAQEFFGDRVYVRFDLEKRPLLWQGLLRFRQAILSHLNW
ncbi:site-2 protease family protein [Massilia sp. W12]|uniref:site-2 protease family protein n=1 Tax=Massilia sp. W12 TaxID=3126507 RepID=UPI0030CD815F